MRQSNRAGDIAAGRVGGQERGAPSVFGRHEDAARDGIGWPSGRHGAPSSSIEPPTTGSIPNSARSRRLLPEPSAPVTATTSPARTTRSKLAAPGINRTPAMRRTISLACRQAAARAASSRSRPIIARTAAAKSNGFAWSATRAPVAQDHDPVGDTPDVAKAMGDVEHADAAPRSADRPPRKAGPPREPTGSRWAHQGSGPKPLRRQPGQWRRVGDARDRVAEILVERRVKSDPVGDLLALAGRCAWRQARPRRRRKIASSMRFSATVRPGTPSWSVDWWTTTIPAARAACGEASRNSRPATTMRPLSGRTTPAAIFASVDFPAPFAPMSATTSPASMARSTSSSACVAPNRFDTEKSESAGATAEGKSSIEARGRRA